MSLYICPYPLNVQHLGNLWTLGDYGVKVCSSLVKKNAILESDADNSGGCACVGTQGLGEIPGLSSQFIVNLKLI